MSQGADTIHYFQWRKGRSGSEKFHGTVIDHEGSTHSRVFKECAEISAKLRSLADVLEIAPRPAEVAMLYDGESRWSYNASIGPKTTPS